MIGKLSELQKEKNEQCTQRHELAVERLRTIVTEETVDAAYISYFQDCTLFLLELENTQRKIEDGICSVVVTISVPIQFVSRCFLIILAEDKLCQSRLCL